MQVLTGRPHQPPQQQQLEEMPPIPLSPKGAHGNAGQ